MWQENTRNLELHPCTHTDMHSSMCITCTQSTKLHNWILFFVITVASLFN